MATSLLFGSIAFAEENLPVRSGTDPSAQPMMQTKSLMAVTGSALSVIDSNSVTANAYALVNTLLGSGGVTVSNIKMTGSKLAAGKFTGGNGIIGFNDGIILSTGAISNVVDPNTVEDASRINNTAGDNDLNALINSNATRDAVILEFDFVPEHDILSFQYVLASEEYNEYVNLNYNDVFGFFVNGKNAALIPNTTTLVSVNSINGGNPLGTNAKHPEYYINNDRASGAKLNTQMDGLTKVLPVQVNVNKGQVNHIKMAIADVYDSEYDTNVFIKAGSFTDKPIDNPPVVKATADRQPDTNDWYHNDVNVTFTATDDMGVVSIDPPVVISTEGVDQEIIGTATDTAGQKGTTSIKINLDKTAPQTTAETPVPGASGWYNADVNVTLSAVDNLSGLSKTQYRINGGEWKNYTGLLKLSSEGSNFLEYQSFDAAGNEENIKSMTINIDKIAPTASVSYSKTTPTNQEVIATITPSEDVTVTNNSGASAYTFNENGSFTFEFVDAAGNKGSVIATVANNDKVAPTITVAPYTTTPTNQDVIVTATTNEGTLNAASHTFSKNGSFSFTAIDAAGNISTQTVTIDNIDKLAPTITVAPYTTTPTNQDVIVTATTNEGTLNAASHTFSENGSFSFTAIDAAGNTSTQTVTIDNIDKVAPVISFTGNLNAYTVDQNINISCSVVDVLSGLLTTNCHDIVGPASGFTLGNNSYTFTATDNVGNVSTSTISFTLSVNTDSLGKLTRQYFKDASFLESLISKLNAIQASISKGNTNAKSGQVGAFINQIEAKIGKSITNEQAQILIQLAKKL
ncbi:choice-of-anchor L domain-containing protein [Paenibacillus agricola]|nr:choice-of-anchor L domain-containing protein [Paenibacillus agricola]